jgi:hypothetical protein
MLHDGIDGELQCSAATPLIHLRAYVAIIMMGGA